MKKLQTKRMFFIVITTASLFGWGGENHSNITKAALDCLPGNQLESLGSAADSLVNHYCLNPDYYVAAVRTKNKEKEAFYKPYIELPLLQNTHRWHRTEDDYSEICFYMTTKTIFHAVDNLKKGNNLEAAKYLGSLCHFLEDNTCPAHVAINQMTSEMLPSDEYPGKMDKHRAMDNAKFKIDIDGYNPGLLGENIVEVSEAIYFRFKENRINSRAQLVPLLQAIYAKNKKAINQYANNAAKPAVKLVADVLYTVCVLAAEK